MDISYFLTAAQAGAIEAGDMLKKNINSPREIEFKGAVNLVTNFDKYAQKLIFQYLYSRFPDHDFLAEEGLTKEKGSEYRWIIDPIDGTTNYAHKFPVFCVSIALERNQEVVMGVVYGLLYSLYKADRRVMAEILAMISGVTLTAVVLTTVQIGS